MNENEKNDRPQIHKALDIGIFWCTPKIHTCKHTHTHTHTQVMLTMSKDIKGKNDNTDRILMHKHDTKILKKNQL